MFNVNIEDIPISNSWRQKYFLYSSLVARMFLSLNVKITRTKELV